MRQPGLILGYHGCDAEVRGRILAGDQEVETSQNDYDWLGSGAYFWENSYVRAFEWAQFQQERGRVRTPAVIGAIIDPGFCLDLTEASCLDYLEKAYFGYLEVRKMFGLHEFPHPKNQAAPDGDPDLVFRRLDCAVINFLHLSRESEADKQPFNTVRCPFSEGPPVFPGAKIPSKTHIQWCVREPEKFIRAYFRPREDQILNSGPEG